jgi:hypothetical protein
MGFDLTSESGDTYQVRSSGWSLMLYVAEAYGWEKQGSIPPDGVDSAEWDGGYATNDGQRVTRQDAQALADACERMLADPERVAKVRGIESQLDKDVRELAREQYGVELPAGNNYDEYPIDEAYLREFVHFCRRGGFKID